MSCEQDVHVGGGTKNRGKTIFTIYSVGDKTLNGFTATSELLYGDSCKV